MDNIDEKDTFDDLILAYESVLKINDELTDEIENLKEQVKLSVKIINQYKYVYDLHVSLSKMSGEKPKSIN